MIISTISVNAVYSLQASSKNPAALPSPNPPKLHAIKKHLLGQQIPTGKDLIVLGNSSDNATSKLHLTAKYPSL
jgi:hypothetical protein